LAISVTESDVLANALIDNKLPVISFDSPFKARHAHLSLAYVGTDNLAFGQDLARAAKRLRPAAGSLCLMSSINHPNLELRILGVRQLLSGNPHFPEHQKLQGEGGWTEIARCPWNVGDTQERALNEVAITLADLKPDVFISVGHWPVLDPAAYRKVTQPYSAALIEKRSIMIVGVGETGPQGRALLSDKLVHAYVSIDFEEIGKKSYLLMRAIVDGKSQPATTYTSNLTQFAP
jgi:ribose transport system substrate-binding protein